MTLKVQRLLMKPQGHKEGEKGKEEPQKDQEGVGGRKDHGRIDSAAILGSQRLPKKDKKLQNVYKLRAGEIVEYMVDYQDKNDAPYTAGQAAPNADEAGS